MTISIDSNVIAALWNPADRLNAEAGRMLGWARLQGMLVLAGPAYSELRAGPLREEAALDRRPCPSHFDRFLDWGACAGARLFAAHV